MSRASSDAPGADRWVPETVGSLDQLRTAAQSCEGCELFADATQVVMGDGREDARIMLVGEQPGDKEDLVGEPFVGPAGKLLDKALDAAGLSSSDVFATNAVKHFRFTRSRGKQRLHKAPGRTHVVACQPWLEAELGLVRPEGVVLLGATAGSAVYGGSFRLGSVRGKPQSWPEDRWPLEHPPGWVLATMHPSGVLRSRQREKDFDALVADLRTAADHLR